MDAPCAKNITTSSPFLPSNGFRITSSLSRSDNDDTTTNTNSNSTIIIIIIFYEIVDYDNNDVSLYSLVIMTPILSYFIPPCLTMLIDMLHTIL